MPNEVKADRELERLAALDEIIQAELGIAPPSETTPVAEAGYVVDIRTAIRNLKAGVR